MINDIYQRITDKIIQDLEKGELTWRKPWSSQNMANQVMLPLRSNGVPYTGINTIILWATAVEKGFSSPHWMTMRQANAMKGKVRKGEKSTQVVFADKLVKEETDASGQKQEVTIPYLKAYWVFNASQIEGLGEDFYCTPVIERPNPEQRIEALETFFAQTKATIYTGKQAAYYLGKDSIEMPPFESFIDAPSYYGTLAHEVTHWTRHPSRLNRDFNRKRWGDEGYAKEELVAELGSCFLSAELGLEPPIGEAAAYIQSWLKELRDDKRLIFQAASHAQKAVEYVKGLQPKNINQ